MRDSQPKPQAGRDGGSARPQAPLLQIENLSKVFHIRQGFASQDFHAVDNASIIIESDKPEIFAVVGESGSGKTTLAKMVLGMETSSEGILRYKNRVINDISRKELKSWFYPLSASLVIPVLMAMATTGGGWSCSRYSAFADRLDATVSISDPPHDR